MFTVLFLVLMVVGSGGGVGGRGSAGGGGSVGGGHGPDGWDAVFLQVFIFIFTPKVL